MSFLKNHKRGLTICRQVSVWNMPRVIVGLSLVMRRLVAFAHASWDASIHTIHTAEGLIIVLNKVAFSNQLIYTAIFTKGWQAELRHLVVVLSLACSHIQHLVAPTDKAADYSTKAPGALVKSNMCMGLEDAGDLTSSRAMQQHIPPQSRGLPTYPANMRQNDMSRSILIGRLLFMGVRKVTFLRCRLTYLRESSLRLVAIVAS
ncbi:hypothetical protein F4679DRAFT_532784 [Xylaria curta]|nr:hypothetical protein F4679DRAFT_532784 [Xylaria curta]